MTEPLDSTPPLLQPGLLQLQYVQEASVPWLWPGRLACGRLNLLVAPPGMGKSLIALDIAARVSAGRQWPDLPEQKQEPGGVLLVTDSAQLADTVLPRLNAAGADLTRINALTSLNADPFAPQDASSPRLHDLSCLEQAVDNTPECRLLLVDPIVRSTPDSVAVGQMTSTIALAPLCRLAAHRNLALLAVAPIRTLASAQAVLNAVTSLTFNPLAATVWTVAPDKHQKNRRLLLSLKATLTLDTPTLPCRIIASEESRQIPHVMWEDSLAGLSLEHAFDPRDTLADRTNAASWLEPLLRNGPVPASHILDQAKYDGITHRSARDALTAIGGTRFRKGFGPDGKWLWALSPQHAQQEPTPSRQSNSETYDVTECCDYEEDLRLRKIELEQEFEKDGFFYAPPDDDDDF